MSEEAHMIAAPGVLHLDDSPDIPLFSRYCAPHTLPLYVKENSSIGQLKMNQSTLSTYFPHKSPANTLPISTPGHKLLITLRQTNLISANASVLSYLYHNPALIPTSWTRKSTKHYSYFFWGTIFKDAAGTLWVPYLYWSTTFNRGREWKIELRSLSRKWNCSDAAVIVNNMIARSSSPLPPVN